MLLNRSGTRIDRMAATRRLRRLQNATGVRIARMHPHMPRTARAGDRRPAVDSRRYRALRRSGPPGQMNR